jgi:hypothetical protein
MKALSYLQLRLASVRIISKFAKKFGFMTEDELGYEWFKIEKFYFDTEPDIPSFFEVTDRDNLILVDLHPRNLDDLINDGQRHKINLVWKD